MSNAPEKDSSNDDKAGAKTTETEAPDAATSSAESPTEEAAAPAAAAPAAAATSADTSQDKPKRTLSRAVLLLFLLVAIVVLFQEYRARSAFSKTYESMSQAMEDAEDAADGGLFKGSLEAHLVGNFVLDTTDGGDTFIWQGIFKTYKLQLTYGHGGFVKKIETK